MRGRTAAAPLRTEICHLRHIRACFGFRGERPHSIICRKGENGQPQKNTAAVFSVKTESAAVKFIYQSVSKNPLARI